MDEKFLTSEDILVTLKSTWSGRAGSAGYDYQRGYAVSRLASMVTSKPLSGLKDYPKYLRYDWGEDLDEVLQDDSVCFTQCKRVKNISQPAKLADVLLGFASKWLLIPSIKRDYVLFRLVSCDRRFRSDFRKEDAKANVLVQFKKLLNDEPSPKSDRAGWQDKATAVGFEALFNALWNQLSFVYFDSTVINDSPAGAILPSEDAARRLLVDWGFVIASKQKAAIEDLRCLIHKNLIEFDPTNDAYPSFTAPAPISLNAADVEFALWGKKESDRPPPFELVDRVRLSKARALPKEKFLFKSPEWCHVVHGTDSDVKFVERDQTEALLEAVRKSLLGPLKSGYSNLQALFVRGPPGAGKSTLVRRVAAILVELGEVVVADAGINLVGKPDVQYYTDNLQRLAGAGRAVLLVLDDPLRDGSEWVDLLFHLKSTSVRVAVIAATPDFWYQCRYSELSQLSLSEFKVDPPSPQEKQRFAEMYKRDINTFGKGSDDFLIMVAEAEADKPFPEIMERLWRTLNHGFFDSNRSFAKLPWEVRAFWFVCFLHRYGTPCPLSILKAALELSGGAGELSVEAALRKLKAESGWNIFQHYESTVSALDYQGDLVSTANQKIASAAWNKRPRPSFDHEVNEILAQATVKEPQSVRTVASAAGTMAKAEPKLESGLANELIVHWQKAAAESQRLETRYLCELVAGLSLGGRNLVEPMRGTLRARVTGKDGWLAAQQLRVMSSDDVKSGFFPEDINLKSLIAVADFSVAPTRARRFFQQVGSHTELMNAVYQRLFESLERRLDWQIGSSLLEWLLSHAPKSESVNRLSHIINWLGLESHKDDSNVRTQYLFFLQSLPKEFDEQRKQAATDTAAWLEKHDNDTYVRTQYLSFLQSLKGKEFDEQRKQAATDTAAWLENHHNDTSVRTQYLSFLQGLKGEEFDKQREQAATDTAAWLEKNDKDTCVRTQYLTFLQGLKGEEFDKQREQAATDTAAWLKKNDEDTTVRAQYLTFLQNFPAASDEQRINAAKAISDWLDRHPDSHLVTGCYVSFLRDVPLAALEPLRQASDKHHQRLIAKNPANVGHNFIYAEQLRHLSRFDEAVTQYDAVLKKRKGHQMARRGRALVFQKLGQMPEAEAEFKLALWWARDKKESEAIFHTSLGEFYLGTHQWGDAIDSFKEAQDKSLDYFGNHRGIAKAQVGLGKFDEAEDALQRALEDPNLKQTAQDEIVQLLKDVSLRRS